MPRGGRGRYRGHHDLVQVRPLRVQHRACPAGVVALAAARPAPWSRSAVATSFCTRCAYGKAQVIRPLTTAVQVERGQRLGHLVLVRSSSCMLFAGEQLLAPYRAMPMASWTFVAGARTRSRAGPGATRRPRRRTTGCRCSCRSGSPSGRWPAATCAACAPGPDSTATASTGMAASSSHRGVFWSGHRMCRMGTYGGSVRVGVVPAGVAMAPARPARCAIRATPLLSSVWVTGAEDTLHYRCRAFRKNVGGQRGHAVGGRRPHRHRVHGYRVGHAAAVNEGQRGRAPVVDVDADHRDAAAAGAVEPGDQRRLLLARRAPGREEVDDERAACHGASEMCWPGGRAR